MGVFDYVELALGTALSSVKNHYHKTLSHDPILVDSIPKPNLTVTSTSYPDTPNEIYTSPHDHAFAVHAMREEHTQFGADAFPGLDWTADPALLAQVKEWAVIVEDPDAPVWFAPLHSILYRIPADNMHMTHEHLTPAEGVKDKEWPKKLAGGATAGKNVAGVIYGGGRPPFGHGPHLYFYQVVGLGDGMSWDKHEKKGVSVEKFKEAAKGKVVCWGMWVGKVEHVWKQG